MEDKKTTESEAKISVDFFCDIKKNLASNIKPDADIIKFIESSKEGELNTSVIPDSSNSGEIYVSSSSASFSSKNGCESFDKCEQKQ